MAEAIDLVAPPTFDSVFADKMPEQPFLRWHLRRKTEVMVRILEKYLGPEGHLLDVGCGDGDALFIARAISPRIQLHGLDINIEYTREASRRVPSAEFVEGNMYDMSELPEGGFDYVHEFGASFYGHDPNQMANLVEGYLRLLKPGGLLFWSLPEKWSMAHISYTLTWAPKIRDTDTKLRRVFRSLSPRKYCFVSKKYIRELFARSAYGNQIVEEFPIWHFFWHGPFHGAMNKLASSTGESVFERCDALNARCLPKLSGYYLVVRRQGTPSITPSSLRCAGRS